MWAREVCEKSHRTRLHSSPGRNRRMSTILNRLPLLGASDEKSTSGRSPYREVTNPGDSQPHSQQFVAPPSSQGTTVTHVRGGITNSNGQTQRRDVHPGSNGVTVTQIMNGIAARENGEIQIPVGKFIPNHGVKAVKTHRGLAEDVHAGSQGFSTPIKTIAKSLPLTVDVHAGNSHPGKLPVNVMIR